MDRAYSIIIGIGAIVAAIVIILLMLLRKPGNKPNFDERQLLARGKAYKAGFFTLTVYMILYGITELSGLVWCENITGVWIGVIIGAAVFCISAIHHDAYFGMRDNVKTWAITNFLIALLNLTTGIIHAAKGNIIGRRGLTFYSVYFFIAGLFVLIAVSLIIHNSGHREDDEE